MPASGTIGIILCGDVMLGRGVDQILPHSCDPTLHEDWRGISTARAFVELAEQHSGAIPGERGIDYVWGDALVLFAEAEADARIVNLETAVTARGHPWPGKDIHYRMHPDNVGVLNCARIDACALANNHTLDWGHEGLAYTLAALAKAGLRLAGAGTNHEEASAPAILPAQGKGRILLFSLATAASGVPTAWSAGPGWAGINLIALDERHVEQMRQRVQATKRSGDIVIASIHWGDNWGYAISPQQEQFARALIDRAAVDVVHGHSSHHAKAIEVYKGKLILYGCGDLINDYEGIAKAPERASLRPDLGVIYCARVRPDSGTLAGLQMQVVRMRRLRVERASEADAAWLAAMLDRESAGRGARFTNEGDKVRLAL